jgi:CHRD domain-containing protein
MSGASDVRSLFAGCSTASSLAGDNPDQQEDLMRRTTVASTLSLAAAGLLLSVSAVADNGTGKQDKINTDLTGFQEVPVVITTGEGQLRLVIDESARTIDYTLTYSGLQADITQSHIHVAQKSVNGAIVLWLCKTAGTQPSDAAVAALTPFCPGARSGTVNGTLRDANALASTGPNAPQQIAGGSLDDVLIAIEQGKAYGNVHTTVSPGGEIRGQINAKKHDH